MTFTVGGVDVTAVHVGATAADAVYLGDVKVWPTAAPWTTLFTFTWNPHALRFPGPGEASYFNSWHIMTLSDTDAAGAHVSTAAFHPGQRLRLGPLEFEVATVGDHNLLSLTATPRFNTPHFGVLVDGQTYDLQTPTGP